jgi:hypothetical protein
VKGRRQESRCLGFFGDLFLEFWDLPRWFLGSFWDLFLEFWGSFLELGELLEGGRFEKQSRIRAES